MRSRFLFLLFPCLLFARPVAAGVPQIIHPATGTPVGWADPQAIPYWVDQGSLGRLSHTQARELLEAMMGVWEEVEPADLHFQFAGLLGEDVTAANIGQYVDGTICAAGITPHIASMRKGESPIIFDTDGTIIDLLAGKGASRKIVGRSGYRCYDGSVADPSGVTQAFVIMNGRFLDGAADPEDLATNAFAGILLHELGHFLGLHHSMVNETIFTDLIYQSRPADDSRFIPVMYPLVFSQTTAGTVLKPDDMSAIAALYPTAEFATAVSRLSGTIFTAERIPFRGANVVARRQDDPLCEAVATISGRFCTPLVDAGGTASLLGEICQGGGHAKGEYRIAGLAPGDYTIEVSEVITDGGARTNMFPKALGADLPGPAEYYNTSDASQEDAEIKTVVAVGTGAHLTALDIFLGKNSGGAVGKSLSVHQYTAAPTTHCQTDPVEYTALIAQVAKEESAGTPIGGASGAGEIPAEGSGGCALTAARTPAIPLEGGVGLAFFFFLLLLLLMARSRPRNGDCPYFRGLSPFLAHSAIIGIILIGFVSKGGATSVLPVTPAELAASAGRIFYGECIAVDVAVDERGLLVTDVTYAVHRTIKGNASTVVTFRLVGDARTAAGPSDLAVSGSTFTVGHEDLLFLYPASEWGFTSPVGGGQGHFPVYTTADGVKIVRNPFATAPASAPVGKAVMGKAGGSSVRQSVITPDALLDRILKYVQHPQAP